MSHNATTAVWDHSEHEASALAVMLAIADHADTNGYAFPGIAVLAVMARTTERNVTRVIRTLVESKELSVSVGTGPHGCNEYRLNLDFLESKPNRRKLLRDRQVAKRTERMFGAPPDNLSPRQLEHFPPTIEALPPDTGVTQTVIEQEKKPHPPNGPAPAGPVGDLALELERSDPPRSPNAKLPTSATALQFAALFNRRPTTPWADKEIRAFKKLHPINPDDLALVVRYYQATHPPEKDIRRRDLYTLLNNFSGEVDRARAFKAAAAPTRTLTK